jgi:hypothetical protein
MRSAAALALLFIAITSVFAQQTADLQRQFDEAERRIVRLPPTAFPELPAAIVRELQRRGCTIPQTALTKEPENVIRGRFANPDQLDWAVLCSVKEVSTILVFWNGSASDPAEIAQTEDRNFLQGISPGQIGYSREISAVKRDFIMRQYHAYGGPKPPPINHEGLDDAFVEKASVAWYFYKGKWMKLTGSD